MISDWGCLGPISPSLLFTFTIGGSKDWLDVKLNFVKFSDQYYLHFPPNSIYIYHPQKSFPSQISPAGTFYNISPNVLFRIKFRNVQHLFSTHFTL